MAKVGRTTRSPADRALELSAATGVATPFVVAFDQEFEDCSEAERVIHDELDRRGLRVAPNREFFRGAPSEIIRVIIEVAERHGPVPVAGPLPSADRLRLAADRALFGQDDTMQDTGEALRLYKLAGARGSLMAFERMGLIYSALYLASRDRAKRRRAVSALKEGARRGNYYCYCELAVIFTAERQAGNFAKAWDLFFARRQDARVMELDADQARFGAACARYIFQALDLGIQPVHRDELTAETDGITAALLAQLDAARGKPLARQLLATALRWVYETLHDTSVTGRVSAKPGKPTLMPGWVCDQAIATV
jgi:GNAT superfamily N-acetyltransferase